MMISSDGCNSTDVNFFKIKEIKKICYTGGNVNVKEKFVISVNSVDLHAF